MALASLRPRAPEPALEAEVVGAFVCGTAWGIAPEHRYVHACRLTIPYVRAGQGFLPRPHTGDHVCRCGDRRAQGKTPA